jgi:hypothetical protein
MSDLGALRLLHGDTLAKRKAVFLSGGSKAATTTLMKLWLWLLNDVVR